MERRFSLGCAVWAYKEWLGELFPPGSKSSELLRLYSRRLTTVEGNTTFYAVPSADTVARWATETPSEFRFCFKLPQEISHQGPLAAALPATQLFLERMAPLGERLGPFFLQLPPGYRPRQIDDLERWLAAWPRQYALAVEVRHLEWFDQPNEAALMALLERYGAGRVLMDVRPLDLGPLPGAEEDLRRARDNKPDVPLHPVRTSGPVLVRYIGHPDVERNGPLLDEWAERVTDWIGAGADVYFFMHCPVERVSPQLCRAFQRRLDGRSGIPALPWDTLGGGAVQQEALF
jgi:uncharacterized protein YecE (DUF72 family)